MSAGGRGGGARPGLAQEVSDLRADFVTYKTWATERIERLEAFRNWMIGVGVGSGVLIGLAVQIILAVFRGAGR